MKFEGREGWKEKRLQLGVKKGEEGGGNLADLDVETERAVDGEDGERELKRKLAIPGLWDEGFK